MKAGELFSVKEKTVLITGASQGIGEKLAQLYMANGANVALIARSEEKLKQVKESLYGSGKVEIFPFDVTEFAEMSRLVQNVKKTFASIDILVNNAGTNRTKPAFETTENDWDAVLDLNLKSTFFLSQAVYPVMKSQGKGKIIQMSSQMAEVGYYKRAAYSSSKGGVRQLTKALAVEWASDQINVNAVGPTFIETPLTKSMFADEAFKEDVFRRIPLGRMATAEDLYGAMLYLSSNASDMVTGQTLYVDGGWTIW
ncbi:SDR family NAD(P)-dependent oxidoreductase [Shouchella patagoniensis]|uniref:SDR family NAD(P)-dependent oxidoreductase n=1 Tax=Shouchella patagoniensis TaxID=228576 RepID=UPI001FE84E25|nr:glucose 1-dehydrogenase [Shouchella patagoniensis]